MRIPSLLLALGLSAPAWASGGIPVSIKVVDEAGAPIQSAVVRHPDEKERHRVNMATGVWTGDAVYLVDGTELTFDKNMELTFEVSAPGYQNERFSYIVKKRKNVALVTLNKLDLEVKVSEEEEEGGPVIGFKHDVPRD
ncbi:MAG: hypothetical protein R3F61_09370 [Myxococcota bacterium]